MKILNKKSLHNYFILESLEAGIELLGSEVKSIREGRIELGQSFGKILNGEVYLINVNIPPYHNAPIKDYNPTRQRRLLLHKDQIRSLIGQLSAKSAVLFPVSMYDKHNIIKVQLGLGKSKREVDKRRILKERDHQRRIEQELRGKE
ncbi:MAG: SsrA-binding protein SmpB [Candidatus Daviesbacteria bacterium]|nr:SsrA-binding protein SmpB [Candidatus Daviesbacteria bacterium]